MICLKESELLRHLIDPQSNSEQESVVQHLHVCERCRVEFERLAATNLSVDTWLLSLETPSDEGGVNTVGALTRLRNRIQSQGQPASILTRPWLWVGAATVTCVILIMLFVRTNHRDNTIKNAEHTTPSVTVSPPQVSLSHPKVAAIRPRNVRAQTTSHSALAQTSDFVELGMGAPAQMGVIVRVTLPASVFASLGVVGTGDFQADLLVGEDGIAHAIRFVH